MRGVKSQIILNHKRYLMGVAILLICLLHALVQANITFVPVTFLNVCVDIFLIMSAIGCSISMEKNQIKTFYRNRFVKVLPIFAIYSIIQTAVTSYYGEPVTFVDYVCNATTLSFWGLGGWYQEWYVCASFALWLSLPFFVFITKKLSLLPCFISIALVVIIMLHMEIKPQYSLFISRIPIFMFGVFLFVKKESPTWIFLPVIFIALFLGIYNVYCGDKLCVSLLSPIILCALIPINSYLPKPVLQFTQKLGGKTLEIYLANILAMYIIGLDNSNLNWFSAFILNFASTCILSLFFISINHIIKRICLKFQ